MIKLQQYYVFKISTSRLNESGCKIENLTVSQARLNGEIVQIGDNQVFRSIRKIKNTETDIDNLKVLIEQRNSLKKSPSSEENSLLISQKQKEIDDILFVPDIVNVKVDDKGVYKKVFKEGFVINGIRFFRLCSGAGQSRQSTATFVNEEIKDELERMLNCGLKVKKINIAKYNAYFGLHMSSTYPVRKPRVCLIGDCEDYPMMKTVDWVDDIKDDVSGKEKRKIKEKEIEFIPNMWDGQGLISPRFAKKWQEDLDLDYLPSQFGIRSAFIKGMLVNFDFHSFAKKVAKTDKIIDHYGDEWDIDDIDVLLSVSQFKMYKYYKTWDEYEQLHELHGHSWGVTKVNPRSDNQQSLLNYQYIQTLDLNREKIESLINPTTEWIKKICEGDKLYILLFLLGVGKKDDSIKNILDKTSNDYVKAVLYNDSLLKDPHVRSKIYNSVSTKVEEAKIGRIWVNGNYQAMISCPYGQAQWAFKKEVTGLLKEYEHYSHFWNKRKTTMVDACRSPMVDFHEHNVLNFIDNEQTKEWYKYIKSGIIYNVWGVDTIRHSDSDWDYDIVFTTDNEIILNNIYPDRNVITYEKSTAPFQTLTGTNILKTDLRSFDCKVGTITNYSTTFITMLANFREGTPEYIEMIERIKLLRRYIGDSIDQAKGIKMKPFPSEWKKRIYINDTDSDEEKKIKYYHNSLVASRKPYFMIYIYDKLRNEYKEYKKKSNRACKEKFGCSLEQLVKKKEKTKQESYYVSDYYRRMPVIKNKSVMNTLCSMVEDIEFKYKRPNNSEHIDEMYRLLFDSSVLLDQDKLEKLISLKNKYDKKRHFKYRNSILQHIDFEVDDSEEASKQLSLFYEEIRNEASSICSNPKELANHLIHIVYNLFPNDSKDFAWSIGMEGILEILKEKNNNQIEIPMPDKDGIEYLGKKYSLRSLIV